jgi:ubiquinone/menaquinone biosynthesis C-methylase UbiE
MDKFINIQLTTNTLHEYVVRTLLFKSLKNNINEFKGNLLDVGCGEMPYKSYIIEYNTNITSYTGIDLPSNELRDTQTADKIWDGKTIPFDSNSFDTILCTEVLEHCFEPDIILAEIYRVLKKNGVAYFTIPFVYPLHEVPYDAYRYTPYGLEYRFKKAQFNNIKIIPLGGWEASIAQIIGLWYFKRRFKIIKASFTIFLLKSLIKFLLKKDVPPIQYTNNELMPGFAILAKKQTD